LFNALNTPSTLSPANGDFVPATTGLGNEIINPLAQVKTLIMILISRN
jgi:hypothetical protein